MSNIKLDMDRNIFDRFLNGDKKAFDLLFLRYHPILVRFISGFVKDTELAKDMSQDIFVRVWTQRNELSEIKSFSGYLFKNARFAIYNHYDHILVNRKFVSETAASGYNESSVEEHAFVEDLDRIIEDTINHMPEQRRRVFEMSRRRGLSNQQIADELGISKRTVENHITTSLAQVRKAILASGAGLLLLLFYCLTKNS